MGVIFGNTNTSARMYIPKATASWSISGLFDNTKGSNAVVHSYSYDDIDLVDIRRCFNETNHIFAFGRDIIRSSITVDVLLFLGKGCEAGGSSIKISELVSSYNKNRVSVSKKSLDILVDDFQAKGFLYKMSIGQVDARTGTCIVSFTFILDDNGGGSGSPQGRLPPGFSI